MVDQAWKVINFVYNILASLVSIYWVSILSYIPEKKFYKETQTKLRTLELLTNLSAVIFI